MRHITRRDPPGRLTDRTVTRKDTEKRSQLSAHVISSRKDFFCLFSRRLFIPQVLTSKWRSRPSEIPKQPRTVFKPPPCNPLCKTYYYSGTVIVTGRLSPGRVVIVNHLPGGNQQACQSRYLNSVSDALMTKINCKKRRRVFPRSSAEYS